MVGKVIPQRRRAARRFAQAAGRSRLAIFAIVARLQPVMFWIAPHDWPTNASDEFTGRMFEAINGMLLDMLAAVARKDYDDRRRRQAQGQAKAKAEGRYKGRPEDAERNDGIGRMLAAGQSWGSIQSATGCSRATIAKIARRLKQSDQA